MEGCADQQTNNTQAQNRALNGSVHLTFAKTKLRPATTRATSAQTTTGANRIPKRLFRRAP